MELGSGVLELETFYWRVLCRELLSYGHSVSDRLHTGKSKLCWIWTLRDTH